MCAILHSIHEIFPPPDPSNPSYNEPITLRKLLNGNGLWQTSKEILGWLFDGITHCILIPPVKVTSLLHCICTTINCCSVKVEAPRMTKKPRFIVLSLQATVVTRRPTLTLQSHIYPPSNQSGQTSVVLPPM